MSRSMRSPYVVLLRPHDGARTDQCHVTDQDIPELRHLVEAAGPQECSQPGNSGILLQLVMLLEALPQLRVGIKFAVRTVHHRAELVATEFRSVTAKPFLPEQDRTRAGQ